MNHSINFFRILFTLVIALFHYPSLSKGYLNSGWIVVEFFFILSGYYLYNTCVNKNLSTVQYMQKRIDKFWFKTILIGLLLNVIEYEKIIDSSFTDNIKHFAKELLLLNEVIPFNDSISTINISVWYVCVLIYASALIYAILKYLPQYHKPILIIICFCTYLYLFNSQEPNIQFAIYPYSLARGILSISIGCILNIFINNYHNAISLKLKNALSIISFIIIIYSLPYNNIFGFVPIVCFIFIIIACMDKRTLLYKILDRPIFSKLSPYCFEIFIIHWMVIKIPYHIMAMLYGKTSNFAPLEKITGIFIYFTILFISAYIYSKVCNNVQNKIKQLINEK